MDASYPNHMRLFLDVYDEKVSFCTGEFINQPDGYNFLQTKLKELSQLDGLASQNKEFLVSTALKLNKDEIITFTSDVIDVKVFHDQLDIKLENDRSISLMFNHNSKRLSEYDISISDGKNEEIFLPTFSNNEYAFRVLEEVNNPPLKS